MLRSLTVLALASVLLAPLAIGCTDLEDSDDQGDLASSDDEVRAAHPIIGRYEGTGLFAFLALDRGTNGKQTFTAKQNVQCIQAPCEPVALAGSWGVRKKTTLRLVLASSEVKSFDYVLTDDGALTLSDETGKIVSELRKVDACYDHYAPPVLEGSGACGTVDFGAPAATFEAFDESAAPYASSSKLADGIYDLVRAERSNVMGSWRETLVVKGARFTRVRQIALTNDAPNPVSYVSGTIGFVEGSNLLRLTPDCMENATGELGVTDLTADLAVEADCSGQLRFGFSNIRVTFQRRASTTPAP